DHCIQYMVAVPLIRGELTAEDYEDAAAADPRIDGLRQKMEVIENPDFSRDYLDPDKRSIGNSVQVFFRDGSPTEKVVVEYPIGHPRRRKEGEPVLFEKFETSLRGKISEKNSGRILSLFADSPRLLDTPVDEFIDLFVV
ncbi:MAG: MmgE/PrpD family protein, partial [Verrucomicrobia bacterium]|nr:MmgE/PrpD family protein [Verrucomicrobiota bacterium]